MELSLGLSDGFPKSRFFIKTLLVLSNTLQLELPKVLRRVHLSNWGQWRRKCYVDSTSFPQLHSAFNVSRKPCLNLCSLKRLKPSLSLEMRQIPLRLWRHGRWRWSNELGCFIQLCLMEKKSFFEKVVFYINKGNIMYISSRI